MGGATRAGMEDRGLVGETRLKMNRPRIVDEPALAKDSAIAVAAFVARHAARRHGARWASGVRSPPFARDIADPALEPFAAQRLFQIEDAVPRAILAWAAGKRRAVLLHRRPPPREVLALQGRGWRCVSLLADGTDTSPHADPLDFVIHDLCHLEKYVAPEHHVAQAGLFSLLDTALDDPRWTELESRLDPEWPADRDRVLADMNGHALFLFVALKRKLWLAWERAHPRETRETSGASNALEPSGAREALETLFDLLQLDGAARDAARAIGARGHLPPGLEVLVGHFQMHGARALGGS